VVQAADGRLLHYPVLGYVVMSVMTLVMVFMYPIHLAVMRGGVVPAQFGVTSRIQRIARPSS
jgi:hypothetical protein